MMDMMLKRIGTVHAQDDTYVIEIDPMYRAALLKLSEFSHIHVLWWGSECDDEISRNTTVVPLPYDDQKPAGVFACRSDMRPNPVLITTCMILDLDMEKGLIIVPWIDAFDGTPVLDIKPYIGLSDRIRDAKDASWFARYPDFPQCMEDGPAFFETHPTFFG